jgi:hypothetical protein
LCEFIPNSGRCSGYDGQRTLRHGIYPSAGYPEAAPASGCHR